MLRATEDGIAVMVNLPTLQRRIVALLAQTEMNMYELVRSLRKSYYEYKYVKLDVFVNSTATLVKNKLVILR